MTGSGDGDHGGQAAAAVVTLSEVQLAFVTDRHLATLSTVRRDGSRAR